MREDLAVDKDQHDLTFQESSPVPYREQSPLDQIEWNGALKMKSSRDRRHRQNNRLHRQKTKNLNDFRFDYPDVHENETMLWAN